MRKRHFEEGATAKEGDLLFTIEPAPFEAVLARAQGTLARAEAQALVDRYAPLVRMEAVSRQEYDDAAAALQTVKDQHRDSDKNWSRQERTGTRTMVSA